MRKSLVVALMLSCGIGVAGAQVSVDFSIPGVSFGINMPTYPQLVPVPGYPVYYDPQANSNYFFYDGMYWVFANDNWYASTWYNGPWQLVGPDSVPLFILRVPVRYYREPPSYFRGWSSDQSPRWGDHWGNSWQQSHHDWDQWNRNAVPARAPLPVYQRQYSGDRYPHGEQQQALNATNYRYQPHDAQVRQHFPVAQGNVAPVPPAKPMQAVHANRPPAAQAGQPPVKAAGAGEHAAPPRPAMQAEHPVKQPMATTGLPRRQTEAAHEPRPGGESPMKAEQQVPAKVAHTAPQPPNNPALHEPQLPKNVAQHEQPPKHVAQHEQPQPRAQAPKPSEPEKPHVAEKPAQEPQKAPEKVGDHGDEKKGDRG